MRHAEASVAITRSPARCPYCHDACGPSDDSVVCNDCLARHHADCWRGSCASCRSSAALRARKPARWGRSNGAEPAERCDPQDLSPEQQAAVIGELRKGEELVWFAQPRPAWAQSFGLMAFGIPWTAFAIFWTLGAAQGSIIFSLFGLPFIAVGLCMLTAPIWAARDARRSLYLLTNQRVILRQAKSGKGITVRSYGPSRLGPMLRRQRKGGVGDLIFERSSRADNNGAGPKEEYGLIGIPEARRVEELIRLTLLDPDSEQKNKDKSLKK